MRKFSKLMLLAMIMLLSFLTAFADGKEPSPWAKKYVENSISAGYVPEHLQSKYQDPITREEFTELVITAILAEVNEQNSKKENFIKSKWKFEELTVDNFLQNVLIDKQFSDTNSKYVRMANALGIINGISDNIFSPNDLITREQAAVMFMNYGQLEANPSRKYAQNSFKDLNTVSDWAQLGVELALGSSFFSGTKSPVLDDDNNVIEKGIFNPKGNLTREQAIIVVYRMAKKNLFSKINIKGYLTITMDQLMHGISIKDNTISLLNTGYDNDYSEGMMTIRTCPELSLLIGEYNSVMFEGLLFKPFGLPSPAIDSVYHTKLLNGEKETFDFDVITINHNSNKNIIVTVIRNDNDGFFTKEDNNLRYTVLDYSKILVLEN
ncbi:S-layer homology domain-containing protein [Clostridiaceae bacterium M8S5]|nr:S-layer homology domain-containing protein [Clostridiaceae bacterium M8S5]